MPAQAAARSSSVSGRSQVEVVRAEDLVETVGPLVAVLVGDLGAVAGVVEDGGRR